MKPFDQKHRVLLRNTKFSQRVHAPCTAIFFTALLFDPTLYCMETHLTAIPVALLHICYPCKSLLCTLDHFSNAFALARVALEKSARGHNRVNTGPNPFQTLQVPKPPRFKCCAGFFFCLTISHGTMLYAQHQQFWRFLSEHSFPCHHWIPSDLNPSAFLAWIQLAPSRAQYAVRMSPSPSHFLPSHVLSAVADPARSLRHLAPV